MAYQSAPYRNATAIANHLMKLIMLCKQPSKEAAMLAREWIELENTKRVWRGVPPLAAHKLSEILALKRASKQIEVSDQPFTELEPPTVTAPPPPSPP